MLDWKYLQMENPTPSNQLKLTAPCGHTIHSWIPKETFVIQVSWILLGGMERQPKTWNATTYGKNSIFLHTKEEY